MIDGILRFLSKNIINNKIIKIYSYLVQIKIELLHDFNT